MVWCFKLVVFYLSVLCYFNSRLYSFDKNTTMRDIDKIIKAAENSSFGLWKLNFLLKRLIPFNRPHGLKVIKVSKAEVMVSLPYQKNNLNHIKGLHACGLATAAEFSSGLLLLYNLGFQKYRLIMQSLKVDYMYQAKTTATARFELSQSDFKAQLLLPLERDGVVNYECVIFLKDSNGELLCEARTNWQIKSWEKVKTKA